MFSSTNRVNLQDFCISLSQKPIRDFRSLMGFCLSLIASPHFIIRIIPTMKWHFFSKTVFDKHKIITKHHIGFLFTLIEKLCLSMLLSSCPYLIKELFKFGIQIDVLCLELISQFTPAICHDSFVKVLYSCFWKKGIFN